MEKKLRKPSPPPIFQKLIIQPTGLDCRNLPLLGGRLLNADSQRDEYHIHCAFSQSYQRLSLDSSLVLSDERGH